MRLEIRLTGAQSVLFNLFALGYRSGHIGIKIDHAGGASTVPTTFMFQVYAVVQGRIKYSIARRSCNSEA